MSHLMPANLPTPSCVANFSASVDWLLLRTLSPNAPDSRTSWSSSEDRSRDTRTMGGFIDSEAKALTVVPCGRPSAIAVTTDTGVATPAMTSRNAACRASGSTGTACVSTGPAS